MILLYLLDCFIVIAVEQGRFRGWVGVGGWGGEWVFFLCFVLFCFVLQAFAGRLVVNISMA